MAAELVETGRLWARVVAPVQPQWVEAAASHLLKWSYGEPEWDACQGSRGRCFPRHSLWPSRRARQAGRPCSS